MRAARSSSSYRYGFLALLLGCDESSARICGTALAVKRRQEDQLRWRYRGMVTNDGAVSHLNNCEHIFNICGRRGKAPTVTVSPTPG